MTKPDWCPQDVWEAAVRLQDGLYHWTDEGEAPQQDAESFAAALLAERERCALKADEFESDIDPDAGRVIAAAIRGATT